MITSGFVARVDQRMALASSVENETVSVPPNQSVAYDRPKVTVGATFTKDILENVPTGTGARSSHPALRPCGVVR